MEIVKLMPDGTYNRESEIEATKASARLPGLDIEIIHRQSPNSEWEQVSINVRATPSFEMLGRSSEVADPFTLWMQAVSLMWMPWMLTTQTMMLPNRWSRTLPNVIRPQQETRTSSG
jgi:hypothetical protein